MPFNKNISGYKNENEFDYELNHKYFKELNPMFSSFIKTLFPSIKESYMIKVSGNYEKQKADIFIEVNNVKKGISIKKGIKNSVYVEPLKMFINFLRQLGIKEDILERIKYYHYADDTIDGTGLERKSSEEYKVNHQEDIIKINKALNQNKILLAAVNRFVLVGNNSDVSIDAILYGVTNDFIWISKKEIIEVVLKYKNLEATGIHFGPLFYQPMNRCLNRNPLYEDLRHKI